MSADSLMGAAVLFAACLGGWHLAAGLKGSGRHYVRFAAVLLAALAVCVLPGLGDVAALFLLPLAGTALGVAAWMRSGVRAPEFMATVLLALALGLGLGGALTGRIILSLLPVIVAALAGLGMALVSGSVMLALGALALGLAAPAFAGQGAGSGVLLLAAAALMGFTRGCRRRLPSASAPPVQQMHMEAARVGAARGPIGAGRRKMVG